MTAVNKHIQDCSDKGCRSQLLQRDSGQCSYHVRGPAYLRGGTDLKPTGSEAQMHEGFQTWRVRPLQELSAWDLASCSCSVSY